MKYLTVVSATVFMLISAQPALAKCSGETVALVQAIAQDSESQFAVGNVSRAAVILAKADVVEAQECAGIITLEQFCKSKKDLLQQAVQIDRELFNNGRADGSHIALRELVALERRCPDAK